MVLVLLGTQKQQFTRLLDYLENINLQEEVLIQKGYTIYNGKYNSFTFTNKLNDLIKKADIVITHGGIGSIMECLEYNKKIIVVPRLKEYNEHVDDHQIESIKSLEKYIMIANNENELIVALKKIKDKNMLKYEKNNSFFNKQLEKIIKKIMKN